MDGQSIWACPFSVLTYDVVGVSRQAAFNADTSQDVTDLWEWGDEIVQPKGFQVVAVTVHCVNEPLFSSALMLAFLYEMMILKSEHVHNSAWHSQHF